MAMRFKEDPLGELQKNSGIIPKEHLEKIKFAADLQSDPLKAMESMGLKTD